jgi:hypothetical protein
MYILDRAARMGVTGPREIRIGGALNMLYFKNNELQWQEHVTYVVLIIQFIPGCGINTRYSKNTSPLQVHALQSR